MGRTIDDLVSLSKRHALDFIKNRNDIRSGIVKQLIEKKIISISLLSFYFLICVPFIQAQAGPPVEIHVIPVEQFESQPFSSNCLGRAGNAGCYQVNLRLEEGFEIRYTGATRLEMAGRNADLINIRRNGEIVEFTMPVTGGNIEIFHPEVPELVISHNLPANVTGSQLYFRADINLRRQIGSAISGTVVGSANRIRRRDFRSDAAQQQTNTNDSPTSENSNFGDRTSTEVYDYAMVQEHPELIGGIAELLRSIRYPEQALRAGVQGYVMVEFVVTETGDVIDPVVRRGIGYGADEEAVRVIMQAKFTPGIQNGRPVRVRYALPVHFRLNS